MASRRIADNRGIAVIEIVIAVAVLGILSVVTVFGIISFQLNARKSACAADVESVEAAIAAGFLPEAPRIGDGYVITVAADGTVTVRTDSGESSCDAMT